MYTCVKCKASEHHPLCLIARLEAIHNAERIGLGLFQSETERDEYRARMQSHTVRNGAARLFLATA